MQRHTGYRKRLCVCVCVCVCMHFRVSWRLIAAKGVFSKVNAFDKV